MFPAFQGEPSTQNEQKHPLSVSRHPSKTLRTLCFTRSLYRRIMGTLLLSELFGNIRLSAERSENRI